MTNTNSNVRMYRNTGKFARFHKMCEVTFYVVPCDLFDADTEWAIFSNESAANMFADAMHSIVVREYKHVCIYK